MYKREHMTYNHIMLTLKKEHFLVVPNGKRDNWNVFLIYKIKQLHPKLIDLSKKNAVLVSSMISYGDTPSIKRVIKTINDYSYPQAKKLAKKPTTPNQLPLTSAEIKG